ncbi:Asp-tRNA(Asn)/Glu-tRNA(Gln) amidotransferase subunit GatA [Sulfurospirillum sp. hDNRA2]|uniref:Asp-tRNA(Asn)/Glu-tRNA(Gln) amidotransferase subunit GatA n=1 Tax=Sulfurospirillum sp. hDNRA2 TaxID=3237298 RepID=UPI0020B7E666|nr:Asp-tRNA(Asn)/Glu-tRNA(Gln) amidotransferase subunit GatA [Sulfurospirillum sp. DNRA8]MCP3652000.1 Asp-tRNA(Asn)/Glu-tRNA(Gln) amidotransferase subunit GatA [Sulfurospirillum sp. DNRA8]MCR1810847.1 Asp-tRNA(Asn)/Glu-tRNA(Gln) amidotransferase subunit GatA [Sulfurospirillum sp. DNRA8]
MITLKEALTLPAEALKEIRDDLKKEIAAKKELGAYVEQLTNQPIGEYGEGIPIALKDNIQVKGWGVTSGSNILQGYVAPYNATVVDNMLRHGLAPFGRTNMDEFAMGSSTESSFYGKTLNPHNPKCVPGGSSGGSAAAVAAGIAIAALGSDTGGSIRQPAAFCGCVGLKPTYGKVSRYGLGAYSSSLDQIGPITQNVEDAAILYDIIAGHEPKDSTSAAMAHESVADKLNPDRKMTIAVIENYLNEASPEVREKMLEGIKALQSAGHTIVYRNFINSKYDIATYYVIATAEASANLSRYDGVRYGNRHNSDSLKEMFIQSRSLGFGEEVKRRILLGTFVLSSGYYDAYYIKAQRARHFIKAQYEAIFQEADLIFMPVTPTAAFEFGSKADPLEMYLSDIYTISLNLAGLPGISVPLGKNQEGLPIGGQLIGQAYGEQALLDGALSLERALGL